MRKFILALSLILGVCGYSHAQTRTFPYFNGPVIPGDCVQLDPTATLLDPVLKDSGAVCGGGGGGGGTPGGSNFSLQTNNSGSFGGVSSVATGSVLASNGTGAVPAWQLKPVFDVRDFGVVGNGTTDDTTAMQNAINAACNLGSGRGGAVLLPNGSNIKLTSTLVVNKCNGITVESFESQGQTTRTAPSNAIFLWYGAVHGVVFEINQTRDSKFGHFTIDADASNHSAIGADVGLLIDEIAPVTNIITNNHFDNIQVVNSAANSAFIGISICPTSPGNCEEQNFDRLFFTCANPTPTSASSNGVGIMYQGAGGAQPYGEYIHWLEAVNCSQAIDVETTNVLDINGGLMAGNWTDLFVNGGRNVSYRHFRSENGKAQIVIGTSSSSGAHDLTVEENSFSGLTNNTTTISYPYSNTGGLLRFIKNDWDNNNTITPFGPSGGGVFVGALDSQDNNYPNTILCFQAAFLNSGVMFVSSNDQPTGGVCNLGGTILGASNAKLNLLSTATGAPNFSTPSPIFTLQGSVYSGGVSNIDYTILRHIPFINASKSYFSFSHPSSTITTSYGVSLPAVFGGVSTSILATPILDGIVPLGVTGATTWAYKLVANDGTGGTTAASTASSTTTGNSVLSGGNCNTIQWRPREGAYNYTIYRTGSGGTPSSTGVISTVWPSQDTGSGYIIQDCGLTGDGTIPPTTNTTGNVSTTGQFISTASTGTPPIVVSSTTVIPNLNANLLNGATFAIPGSIGSTTPSTGVFTTLTVNTQLNQAIGTSHCWNSDSGISRDSAGVFDFGNCTPGDKSGTVQAASGIFGSGPGSLQVTTGAFSRLSACVAGLEGTMAPVNDSTTATWGGTITGSGTNHVLAYCDGTNWTVAAK